MSGLLQSVFGGSSNKSSSASTQESGNKAYDKISAALDPALGYVTQGGDALKALLGLGGDQAQAAAQANFRGTPGYQFALDEGLRGVNASYANRGLYNSGAASKGLTKYAMGLADQTYNNYLDKLLGFSNLGTGAAGLISNAGQYSTGQSNSTGTGSSSSGGLGKAIGFGLSLLSDRQLKTAIVDTGLEVAGLPVYEFSYIWDDATRHRGFMADEVLKLYPEAVSNSGGFNRVNYGMILNG